MLRVHPYVVVAYRLYWTLMVVICLGREINIFSPTLALALMWSFLDMYQDVPHVGYFVLVQLIRMAHNVALLVLHLTTYYGSSDVRNPLVLGYTNEAKHLTLVNLGVLLAFDIYSGLAFHYYSSMERKVYTTIQS